jgi:hypothetical protein
MLTALTEHYCKSSAKSLSIVQQQYPPTVVAPASIEEKLFKYLGILKPDSPAAAYDLVEFWLIIGSTYSKAVLSRTGYFKHASL